MSGRAYGFDSRQPHHVAADVISFAATFFIKVTSHSFCRGSSPNRTRFAGLRFGIGCELESHSIYTAAMFQKERHDVCGVFLFGFRRPEGGSTLRYFKCSGQMNCPCAEVLPGAKRSYGAKAPPARRPGWQFSCRCLSH